MKPCVVRRGRPAEVGPTGPLRAALIRLLANAYADDAMCVCEGDDVGPECEAFRALGWGAHWSKRAYWRRRREEST